MCTWQSALAWHSVFLFRWFSISRYHAFLFIDRFCYTLIGFLFLKVTPNSCFMQQALRAFGGVRDIERPTGARWAGRGHEQSMQSSEQRHEVDGAAERASIRRVARFLAREKEDGSMNREKLPGFSGAPFGAGSCFADWVSVWGGCSVLSNGG